MDDSNPAIGLIIALVFLAVGMAAVAVPGRIQQLARKYTHDRTLATVFLAGFVESEQYVPGMRIMGVAFLASAAFLLIGSALALAGILN